MSRLDEGVACALVGSGTSRVVVLHERDMAGDARTGALLDLVLGADGSPGLGGGHYQDNKAALLVPGRGPSEYGFRFFQVDAARHRVLAGLECSNSAIAAGLFAMLQGMVVPDHDGWLRCVNLGTGQVVRLRVPACAPAHRGIWLTRFCYGIASQWWLDPRTCPQRSLRRRASPSVPYQLVPQGNLFLFAEMPLARAPDSELVSELEAVATREAQATGMAPKVVLFDLERPEPARTAVRATCFYRGEVHRSIPGSAALCLASLLTARELARGAASGHGSGSRRFAVRHPTGVLDVRVRWEGGREPRVLSADFTTHVRLLLYGATIVSPESRPAATA